MLEQRVFVDANVFVSRTLRDWTCLLRSTTGGMFELFTSEDVLAETVRTLRRNNPERPGGATTRLRAAIIGAIDDLVEDFDATVIYEGADPDDRHVHAAAIACHADILLTEDGGFAASQTAVPYDVYNCDDFFVLIDDSAAWMVEQVVRQQQRYWSSRPSGTRKGLVIALQEAGCPNFAKRVEQHLRVLSGVRR